MFHTWINGPVGEGAQRRRTRGGLGTVLVVVPHLVAGTKLMDLLPLLETDHRIQTVFAVPQTWSSWHGTEDFIRSQDGLIIPWHQALHQKFDLVLAASHRGIDEVHGPVLVVPHSAGAIKSRIRSRKTDDTAMPTHGLVREELMRHGQVVASALVLTHDSELDVLAQSCPEAVPHAVIAGDISLDRMRESLRWREHYRRALDVNPGQILVMVSSTWASGSAFERHFDLCLRLLDALPRDRYRVVASLHPNVWTVHGRRQVRAWLSECTHRGMLLLPPEDGWRAALIAGDIVVGDHGSATQYGAAIGIPTMLASFPDNDIRPDSSADLLARIAPRLDLTQPIPAQLQDAMRGRQATPSNALAHRLTSRPGHAATILRRTMYQLLNLPEPAHVPTSPLSLPRPLPSAFSITPSQEPR